MDDERKDETQDQFDTSQSQKPSDAGYPEENPGGSEGDGSGEVSREEHDTSPTASERNVAGKPGTRPGAAGEGSQSTGNPAAAG